MEALISLSDVKRRSIRISAWLVRKIRELKLNRLEETGAYKNTPDPQFLLQENETGAKEIIEYDLGIGEVKTFDVPVTFQCRKLGAGVGVFVQDRSKGISGGIHILLSQDGEEHRFESNHCNVEEAFRRILEEFKAKGSELVGLRAKIAGGSTIFGFGKRNVQSVIEHLVRNHIQIEASDVGGEFCREIRFNSDTGLLFVQTPESGFFKIY